MSYELNAMIIDYMQDTLNTKFEKNELKIKEYPIYKQIITDTKHLEAYIKNLYQNYKCKS